ncbi:MAG TPA: glycosyl hydrolase family 18 protein [Candidatus Dormibacteraeota bacterium]
MRRLFVFCTVLAEVTMLAVTAPTVTAGTFATPTTTVQPLQATPAKTTREIFGYALASSLGDPSLGYASWQFSLLNTVAYFGVHVNSAGALVNDSGLQTWNASVNTNFINAAHANGVKVLLTIVLQDFFSGTPAMCSGLANRAVTIRQAIPLMKNRGADGISVDYEGLNRTCPNGRTARAMMTDFVKQLRIALGSAPYLSVATYGSSAIDTVGFFDVAGMAPYANSFFIMGYDLEYSNYKRPPLSCSAFCLGPTSPLAAYYWNDVNIVKQYRAVIPISKIILGVPYYGRKACVVAAVPNAYPTSKVMPETYLNSVGERSDPAVLPGSYAAHRDVHDIAGMVRWDTWFNTSLGCIRELYIDDAVSLGKKYDLVNQSGLRGVGFWTLNYGGGATELWTAISSHFGTCASVTPAASVPSPQTAGITLTLSAAATVCGNPLYEFWMLPPGGTWTMLQPYSSKASVVWPTSGRRAGTYRFSIWARDSSGPGVLGTPPNTYDTFNTLDFTLTPACATTVATVVPASTASIGTAVTITAVASGCPSPRYEFWLRPPGGSWGVAQAYSTSQTFKWNSVGKRPGTYMFSVWARDATSPNAYDGFDAFDYTLTVKPCATASVSVAPVSSAPVGIGVALTATATACPNPLFEVWVLPPGGHWALAQAYSSSAMFRWNTSGKPAGSYMFSVWVRDASSSSPYDAYTTLHYSLTPVCSGVSVTTFPAGAAGAGNTITMTAKAAGCPNPMFEFWVLAPGGTWTLGQAYSTNAVFNWPTAGKARGVYLVSVWTRDSSSPGLKGAAPNTYDAFVAFNYTLV